MIKITTASQAIDYIHSRHKWSKTPRFERLNKILDLLGHPERQSKYVHITGTNGKGSTSKMVAQLLRKSGLQVGLFTSPYILKFNERIQDDNGSIQDADLLAIMQELSPIIETLDETLPSGLTEFETLTVLMFMYFAKHPVDVVVLEVGVGGTWDSTTIIPDKIVSVVTTVGLDHMHVLGNTLTEIATQKAGIIQKQRPVVVGRLPVAANAVIDTVASAMGAPIYRLNEQFKTINHQTTQAWGETFTVTGTVNYQEVFVDLIGQYQIDNAAVAIQTAALVCDYFGLVLTSEHVATALQTVTWPVRFEKISCQPSIVLDGAHNEPGVRALAKTIADRFSEQTVHLLFGALQDKNYAKMLQLLADLPNVDLHVVGFEGPNNRQPINPNAAAHQIKNQTVTVHENWQSGFAAVTSQMQKDDLILFTGSLYFVSEVRQNLTVLD
ncbi:folylpolyglutamate synthase/dihydrofolate synthase family protein [Weissella sagaensis]|uniref:bifunctional folylpolyglutamate synthase/dihydrofolate synthase n=1 Tax=Weissella sagaensis TaxID=2559928 RepID=UPI0013EDEFD4|nr:folylpolyglutamate synthase/dihydrofolate synthase family protein [Weissella sagaensis]